MATGVAIALAATAGVARAQTPPATVDPAQIGKGLIEQQRRPTQSVERADPNAVDASALAPPPAATPAANLRFTLRAVRFDSSSFLSAEALQATAQRDIGRDVSLSDINAIVARVNALYAARGVVTARAYVPPQAITDGVVRIALIEGRLGAMSIAEGRYTGRRYVERRIGLEPGAPIDLPAFRRRVAAFNRVNDAQVRVQLKPGAQIGLTDVAVALVEPPRNSFQIFADTLGYTSTGRYQGGVVARRNALLIGGDRASVYANASDGGLTGSVSYNLPIADSRLGVTYAHSRISVTQGPSRDLDIAGVSDTASLNFAAPAGEGDDWYLSAVTGASYIGSVNRVAGRRVSRTNVYRGSVGYALTLGLGGNATGSLTQTLGVLASDDSLDPRRHLIAILNTDASAAATLLPRVTLSVAASAQYSGSHALPSNQLFQIGGGASIRGFQPGSGSGASGVLTQVELHYAPPPVNGLDVFGFFDSGKTFSRDFGDRAIGAAGAGLRAQLGRIDVSATYAAALGARLPGEKSTRADARISLRF